MVWPAAVAAQLPCTGFMVLRLSWPLLMGSTPSRIHRRRGGFATTFPAAIASRRHGLIEIARPFTTFSARDINEMRASPGRPVWQRGFCGHLIRGGGTLDRVSTYIMGNPGRWLEYVDNL